DVNSEDEWTKDDYIKQLAGDYVSKKMTEHRDELIRDLIKVVSATVPDQIQDFAAQLTEHSRAAGKLAEGVQQLPAMAKQASEQFCSEKLDAFYRKFQEQLDGHSVRLRAVENRFDGRDSELQTLREHIQELRAALAVANVQPKPPPASAAGFDRDTDATIIRSMASKLVDLSAVQRIMSDWVVSCGIKAEFFTISSSEQVAKQFAVQFSGAAGPAARRVSQVLGAQRLAPGQWKRFEVMAMDEQLEIQGRKLREAFKNVAPDKRWFFDRDRGCLMAGWGPVLRLSPNPGNIPSEVARADNIAQKLALPKDQLAELAYLKRLNFTCGSVAIQEVHQGKKQLIDFLSKVAPRAKAHASYCEGSAVRGGVATIIPAEFRAGVPRRSLVPGRVLRVALQLDGSYVHYHNVHKHDLTIAQLNGVSKDLVADLK
ncbi:unnamed protein product, partial [Prorocentrum cordatum]